MVGITLPRPKISGGCGGPENRLREKYRDSGRKEGIPGVAHGRESSDLRSSGGGDGLGENLRAYRPVLRACEWEKIIFEDKNAGN